MSNSSNYKKRALVIIILELTGIVRYIWQCMEQPGNINRGKMYIKVQELDFSYQLQGNPNSRK